MTPSETEKMLLDKLLSIVPEIHITYHHPTAHPGGWRVHKWGFGLSKMHEHKIDTLAEALKNLQVEH